MVKWISEKLFGTKSERDFKKLSPFVARINDFEPRIKALSDDALRAKLQEMAVKAFLACSCRDYARVDFRVDKKGRPFILEVTPNPDISLNAGYARALAAAGIEYKVFWKQLIEKAMNRSKSI